MEMVIELLFALLCAALVLLVVLVMLTELRHLTERTEINWPLDLHLEERRRWVQTLNRELKSPRADTSAAVTQRSLPATSRESRGGIAA